MSAIMSLSGLYLEIFLCVLLTCKITKSIFKQRLKRYPYTGVSLIPTTVSVWALKIPLSQKSRYLGTYVFFVEYLY